MKNKLSAFLALAFLLTLNPQPSTLFAQGTAFTYQGRLSVGSSPANGAFDFQFQLAPNASGPADTRTTRTNSHVAVSNGLFVAEIDFGALSGQPYWLDIGVRPAGSANPFTLLSPRSQLTPAPYANFAGRAGAFEGAVADSQLSPNIANWGPTRTFSSTINFAPDARPPGPAFTVDNAIRIANLNADFLDGLNAVDFWQLGGNANTTAGAHFLGTRDAQPLELRANSLLGLRLDPGATAANLIVPGNLYFGAATRQMLNLSDADYGIGAQPDTTYFRTRGNRLFDPAGNFAWFAGGQHSDTTFDPGPPSPTGSFFEVPREMMRLDGNGQLIVFGTSGNGVWGRSVSGNGVQGNSSSAGASAVYAENTGSGFGVAGRTGGGGSAVFGDNADPNGWAGNFNGRVSVGGNQHFGTQTRQMLNLWGTQYGIGVQNNNLYFRTDSVLNGAFRWYKGGVHNDNSANPGGGTTMMWLTDQGLSVNGTFVSSSDRNLKENIEPLQPRAVLEKVVALPLSSWNYKADAATRHIGPMAQDFRAAFGLGTDDKGIATIDADGVALAAIQGLNQKLETELEAKNAEIRELQQRLERLEKLQILSAEKSLTPTRF